MNHRELMTLSNRTSDSFIRFWPFSSSRTWSYSDKATQKMMDVTASKQWILRAGEGARSALEPRCEERGRGDAPLLALRPLPADVKHAARGS